MQLNNKFEIGAIYEFEFDFAPSLSTTVEFDFANDIRQKDTILTILVLDFLKNNMLMKCLWKNKVVYFSEQFFADSLLRERKLL